MYRQADEACPRVAHKTGTYRRPRFFILAALVPSAGHTKNSENLIRLVSGFGTRIPLGMADDRLEFTSPRLLFFCLLSFFCLLQIFLGEVL
jgi:hypothetical protein